MRARASFGPLVVVWALVFHACGSSNPSVDAAAGGAGGAGTGGNGPAGGASGSGAGGAGGGIGGSASGGTSGAGAGAAGRGGAGGGAGANSVGGRPGACGPGFLTCNGVCVALDDDHCGNCTTVCSAGKACNGGRWCATPCPTATECAASEVCVLQFCEARCAAGLIVCPDGACVFTDNDPFNCGGCGTACPSGMSCSGGRCS